MPIDPPILQYAETLFAHRLEEEIRPAHNVRLWEVKTKFSLNQQLPFSGMDAQRLIKVEVQFAKEAALAQAESLVTAVTKAGGEFNREALEKGLEDADKLLRMHSQQTVKAILASFGQIETQSDEKVKAALYQDVEAQMNRIHDGVLRFLKMKFTESLVTGKTARQGPEVPTSSGPGKRLSTVGNKELKAFTSAFDTYTVQRQVGSGGSGVVFLVKTSDGQNLALKLLDRSKAPRQKVKRFQNEIQFCQRQASDRIVRVLDYGQTPDGSIFYVMLYYGSTLRDLINKQLPMGERLPLYVQVLDCVEAAHLLGVCHRDVKPENLLYDSSSNRIVLADFGIARFREDELLTIVDTGPSERLANFAYAAPEQRKAGNVVDQPADIYALGLILHEMFTGEIPQGTGIRKIRDSAPDFAYLDELVEMMRQQRPEQRIQSVTRVKQELIGRGNNFVNLQRLDQLKKQVVPES
jgi:hypothetical protein